MWLACNSKLLWPERLIGEGASGHAFMGSTRNTPARRLAPSLMLIKALRAFAASILRKGQSYVTPAQATGA